MPESSALAQLVPTESVQPWNDRVLIRPIEADPTASATPSGLIVPPPKTDPLLRQAQVVAISPWLESDDPTDPRLYPGERVYYEASYEGLEVWIDGVRHLLVDIGAIAGVIRVQLP